MPITVSIGGKLEPSFDERRQIAVESKVFGTCVVEPPLGSAPGAAEGYVNRCIVYGVDQVLHRMIQERHISVVQAPNAIPHHLADFVASSGLQQNGFRSSALS
jgi:hypothetical protein